MATATINLGIRAATPSSGASSNAAPGITRRFGTESNPVKTFETADFDASVAEHLWWTIAMPQNYASGGTVRILWVANATSGSVVWGSRINAVTPGDPDTPLEHASAAATTTTTSANATEARRLNVSTVSPSMDSVAAGDIVFVLVYRDATNGSDSCSVDAEALSFSLDYTTT